MITFRKMFNHHSESAYAVFYRPEGKTEGKIIGYVWSERRLSYMEWRYGRIYSGFSQYQTAYTRRAAAKELLEKARAKELAAK